MPEVVEVDGDADIAQGLGEHHPREASQTRLRQLPDDHRLGEEEDGHPQDQGTFRACPKAAGQDPQSHGGD